MVGMYSSSSIYWYPIQVSLFYCAQVSSLAPCTRRYRQGDETGLDGGDVFFFNDSATTEIYTLALHDALPIFSCHFLILSWLDRFDFVCRAWSRIHFEALELVDAPKWIRRKWYGWNVLVEFYLLVSHSGVTFLLRPSLKSGTMHQAVQTGG